MKKGASTLFGLALLLYPLVNGEVLVNDSGAAARGLRVRFAQPVTLSAFGDTLISVAPSGESAEFVFADGEVPPGGEFFVTWQPVSTPIVSHEWLMQSLPESDVEIPTAPRAAEVATIQGDHDCYQVAISPEGGYVFVGGESNARSTFATSNGDVLWRCELPAEVEVESAAIARDASLVVVGGQGAAQPDRGVFAFSKQGDLLWSRYFTGMWEVQVAVTDDGARVFATTSETLICYSRDGDVLWTRDIDTRGWAIWGISVSPDGRRVLLSTNSDVILCDAEGREVRFFDVVEGNYVVDAHMSRDASEFAVAFRNGEGGSHYVALYSATDGEVWRREVASYAGVTMDTRGNVLAAVREAANMLWDDTGALLLVWGDGGLGIAEGGSRCIVGNFPHANIYDIEGL